jgi:hypothetical protein
MFPKGYPYPYVLGLFINITVTYTCHFWAASLTHAHAREVNLQKKKVPKGPPKDPTERQDLSGI